MHPSLQRKYGLQTADDVAIAEQFITKAKSLGIGKDEIDGLLARHGELMKSVDSGKYDSNAALHQLWDHAAQLGIGDEARHGLLQWQASVADHLARTGEIPAAPGPRPDEVATDLREIEEIMKTDPHAYWRDDGLQHRYYDALSRTGGEKGPLPIATRAQVARIGEIERLMGDRNSDYWRGPQAEAMQAEYRNIMSMGDPASVAAPIPTTPAAGGAPQSQGE